MKIVLLLLTLCLAKCAEYRWALPLLESEICADSPKCERKVKGRDPEHTFCQQPNNETGQNCTKNPLTASSRATYLLGINGIRNEIALGWKISNMNRVHWSTILQRMAEQFLQLCSSELDECTFLGKKSDNVNICQNIDRVLSTEDDKNPYGFAIRKWYSEFIEKDSNFEEYDNSPKDNITNFSHMIWPTLELMGCASSKFPNGILVTCFFFPRVTNASIDDFLIGTPCQDCMPSRPTCSKFFDALCGIDRKDEIDESNFVLARFEIVIISFFAILMS